MGKDLFIELRLYPNVDDDLILLYNNGFPLRKYLLSFFKCYIEGKTIPKVVNLEDYCTDIMDFPQKELHIRIQIPSSETEIYNLLINGVQQKRRPGFCKALLRNSIIYHIEEPLDLEQYNFVVDFSKSSDLDLLSLANKYNIKKMIYDVIENAALLYSGNKEVEPIHFLIDEYTTIEDTGSLKGFSMNFSVLHNSVVAIFLDSLMTDVSQYCKNLLRSSIVAQNLSCYLNKEYIDNDKNICVNVDRSQFSNIRLCSEYLKDDDISMDNTNNGIIIKPLKRKSLVNTKLHKNVDITANEPEPFSSVAVDENLIKSNNIMEETANLPVVENKVQVPAPDNLENDENDNDIIASKEEEEMLLEMLNGAF